MIIMALLVVAIFINSCARKDTVGKPPLENIVSYANVYQDYNNEDLEKLKRFDIVAIEPYYVPNKQFLSDLKASGTIILAYVSIGLTIILRITLPFQEQPSLRMIPCSSEKTLGGRVLILWMQVIQHGIT